MTVTTTHSVFKYNTVVVVVFVVCSIIFWYVDGFTISSIDNFMTVRRPLQQQIKIHQPLYVTNDALEKDRVQILPTPHDVITKSIDIQQNEVQVPENTLTLQLSNSLVPISTTKSIIVNLGDQSVAVLDDDAINVNNIDNKNDVETNIVSKKNVVLGLLWFIAMLSALDRVAMSVAIVPMTIEFDLTDTMKGSIASFFSVGYGLAIIPAGLAVANSSARIVLAIGIATWSISTLITPQATTALVLSPTGTIVPLLIARAMVGAGESLVLPAVQNLLSAWTKPDEKASALAVIISGFQSGTILAYLASPLIMDSLGGWRSLFFFYGVSGLIIMVPWLILSADSPQQHKDNTSSTWRRLQDTVTDSMSIRSETLVQSDESSQPMVAKLNDSIQIFRDAPWMDIIKSKGAWAVVLAHCARNWGLYNTLSWTPTFYYEEYGIGVKESALLSVLPSVAGAIGGFIAGFSADKILRQLQEQQQQSHPGLDTTSSSDEAKTNIRKMFQSISLVGSAVSLGILALHIPEEAWVAQTLLTASLGLLSFSAAGFDAAIQDKAGGKWSGLLYSVTTLPAVIFGTFGVWLTGVVLDATNQDWGSVFSITAGINIVGASAFLILFNSRKEFD